MNSETPSAKPSANVGGSDPEQGILPQPLRPGILRACPACRAWFALEFQRSEPHEIVETVDLYRCKRCDHEVSYARSTPPWTV